YDFDCADTATPVEVTLYVKDESGNKDSCVVTVTVKDTLPPVAECKESITVYLSGTINGGTVSIDAADIDDGSTDNCSIDTMWLDKYDFTCDPPEYPYGTMVTLTVKDVSGNESTCTTMVMVKDTVDPSAACKDTTLYLDSEGAATITALGIDNGSGDNCSIENYWIKTVNGEELEGSPSSYTFNCDEVGNNILTLWVDDPTGNAASCTSTVTVVDNLPPVIVCNEMTKDLWESGEYVLSEQEKMDLTEGTWDNCLSPFPFDSLSFKDFSFECVNVFTSPLSVEVTARDTNGNVSVAYCPVTVNDVTDPVAMCRDTIVILDENGNGLIFPGWVNNENDRESVPAWARTYNELEGGSYDACGIDSMAISQGVFTCADVGVQTVTLTVWDPSNNTDQCTSNVTVIDNIDPVFTPVDDTIWVEVAPGVCSVAVADYPAIEATDVCGVTITQTAGLGAAGLFPLGATTETYVASDGSNQVELTFVVVVSTYNGAPTIDAINDVEIDEDNASTISLTGITPGVDCDSQTVVSVTAVADNPALITGVTVSYTAGATTGSIQLTVAPDAHGTAVVTVTVMDDGGTDNGGVDTKVATFTVTVNAVNDAPVVVGPIDDYQINAAHTEIIPLSPVLGDIFDDVDGDALTITATLSNGDPLPGWITLASDALTASPLLVDSGCVTIAVTATDPGGLSATDEFDICALGYAVGVKDLANNFKVNMFPNPTRDRVTLEISGNIGERVRVSVTNITGKEIFRKDYLSTNLIEIDMSSHVSGMYFVRLNINGNEVVKKLILNRK
ncbi:Alkaline phosphatase, partial [hydrothermal vent metagenome]